MAVQNIPLFEFSDLREVVREVASLYRERPASDVQGAPEALGGLEAIERSIDKRLAYYELQEEPVPVDVMALKEAIGWAIFWLRPTGPKPVEAEPDRAYRVLAEALAAWGQPRPLVLVSGPTCAWDWHVFPRAPETAPCACGRMIGGLNTIGDAASKK